MPTFRRPLALSLVTAAALAAGAAGFGGYQLEGTIRSSGSPAAVGSGRAGAEPARWGGGWYAGGTDAWDGDSWSGTGSGTSGGGAASGGTAGGDTGTGGTGTAGTATSTGTTTEATARQLRGVVDIVTTVDYGQSQAAGTGMVLTSGGEVLTNNHVVDGATSITVTLLSSGRSYRATAVGTSPTNDIAVLGLRGASGLTTAPMGSSSIAVGDAVIGVGNAGNDPGTAAASGTVTALDQQVTASDGDGTSETVTGLIRTSAPIASGDSGGPLLDSAGKVVGIDTAAETSGSTGQTVAGYAIPIDHALDVAAAILSGRDDATYHQGLPAFLGVQTGGSTAYAGSTAAAGVPVVGVVSGSAAERAGLQAGDTITKVGGAAVSSPDALTTALATRSPGDRVALSWVDAQGDAHRATVTLGSGPAD